MLTQLFLMSIATITSISSVDETNLTPNKGNLEAVFEVVDGDTLRFGEHGTSARYRLARINAAEGHTPQGKRLTAELNALLHPASGAPRKVKCVWDHKGKYDRPIVECTTTIGSKRVNLSDYMLKFKGVRLWKDYSNR